MACDCTAYVNCNDPNIEVGIIDDTGAYTHTVNNEITGNSIIQCFQKTTRTFSVNRSWDRDINVAHILKDCASDGSYVACDSSKEAIASATCSEHAIRECNVPWFWDRQRGIYLWKSVREELSFTVASNKTAAFKLKWGTGYFHKICILNSTKTKGKEQFIMVKDGLQSVLAEVDYEYNPFPATEGGGATWGLYGNTVQRAASPDTANVACILLFPTVPKQAIPLDNDVIAYGFYDYNAIEGGFIESSLPKDDGGKDYFYPYWCRAMPLDPLWRQTADKRYDVIYSKGMINLAGTSAWYPTEPPVFPMPFGSLALDSKENFLASCVLQFGEHADSKGVVYNESSFGDLYAALRKIKLSSLGQFTSLYPLVAL